MTACGGGTLRDLILSREVAFRVARPSLIVLAAVAAVGAFWTAHRLESRYRTLLWLDALVLAVPAGAGVAMVGGFSPLIVVIIMGVITGTFGDLMRDVVGRQVLLVLRQGELLYLTAAFGGALVATALVWLGTRGGPARCWPAGG